LGLPLVISYFSSVLSKIVTCLYVYNCRQPGYVIEPLERDALRFTFLREQRRNALEVHPETLNAWERWESRGVLGRLTDK
jgi:hypothetical protein